MNAAFFGFKRVHWRVVQVTQVFLRERHLTPARFDMMRILAIYKDHGLAQAGLQYRLGVSAPTVSRMLKALAKLGFVKLSRLARDRRRGHVTITHVGLGIVEEARETLIDSGLADRMALRGLALDDATARPALETLQKNLWRMRRTYGDDAPFDHPWRREETPFRNHFTFDGHIVHDAPAA